MPVTDVSAYRTASRRVSIVISVQMQIATSAFRCPVYEPYTEELPIYPSGTGEQIEPQPSLLSFDVLVLALRSHLEDDL